MLERELRTEAECLKLRYWRTGRYTPVNRDQCMRLGTALELTKGEQKYLIQGYFDHCETVYNTTEKWEEDDYKEKRRLLERLEEGYLDSVSPDIMRDLKIRAGEKKKYFRHIYFTDAFYYTSVSEENRVRALQKHITSTRYDSELRRQMRLQGEIPRKTMLRHLFILNGPDISLKRVNDQLEFLGYLPLREYHTMTGGERLDQLLIRLLEGYGEIHSSLRPGESHRWLRDMCRKLDGYFVEQGNKRMRFMYFKSLEI